MKSLRFGLKLGPGSYHPPNWEELYGALDRDPELVDQGYVMKLIKDLHPERIDSRDFKRREGLCISLAFKHCSE